VALLLTNPKAGATAKKKGAYKWIALSNTTIGMLMATVNGSSLIIALPAVFRGIDLNPLSSSNFTYLLWILMGYLLIGAVFVVSLGRLGDIYGRVKIYNAGFLIFTMSSVVLSITWSKGPAGAIEIIIFRMVQAVGGSMIMANAAAILTDAFEVTQRGLAMGINMMAAVAGQFIGLLIGGALAAVNWRLVFLVNVPIGAFGTIWAYLKLRDQGKRVTAKIDWWGNITFAVSISAVLIGITYGIQPYGGHTTGWTNPFVISCITGGLLVFVLFLLIEQKVKFPMFQLKLFENKSFMMGNMAGLAAALGQGGLMFLLVMWLQGIWLPIHGYTFEVTPIWGGIYLLPLTFGFLIAGPVSGALSDRFGTRPFSVFGMLLSALSFFFLYLIPADFSYLVFALIVFLNGLSFGFFTAPNTASIMNSVPATSRGAASGMRVTFRNAGTPLSLGLFFSLMVIGLAHNTPAVLFHNLVINHVNVKTAHEIASAPPLGYLFAAFLGYNPMKTLLGPKILHSLTQTNAVTITGTKWFPTILSSPFEDGLHIVLVFAIIVSLIGALLSFLQGKRFVYDEES
jgi:MFS family permease